MTVPALIIALCLSQPVELKPGKASSELTAKFLAGRDAWMAKAAEQAGCKKDEAKPLCRALLGYARGTAFQIKGTNAHVGFVWLIKPKGSGVTIGPPMLHLLSVMRDSVATFGAVSSVKPDSSDEEKMLKTVAAALNKVLSAETGTAALPPALADFARKWAATANHQLVPADNGLQFRDTPGDVRERGTRKLVVGPGPDSEGVTVGLFAAIADSRGDRSF